MDTTPSRQRLPLVIALLALLIAVGTAAGPSVAAGARAVYADNSDKVDGLHAVKATVARKKMKGKLVATSAMTGKLPRSVIDTENLVPGGILPSGATIRGAFATMGRSAGGDYHLASDSISFGYRLSSAPSIDRVLAGSPPTANCPGTAENPEAEPGWLCIYETDSQAKRSVAYPSVGFGLSGGTTRPFGAAISTQSDNTSVGFFWSRGSWAVTAP